MATRIHFDNLQFKQYAHHAGQRAEADFPNGYGVSVIIGWMAYGDEDHPYEVAVIHNGDLCYDTDIASDVLGHQTRYDVESLLRKIQDLPPKD